MPIPGDDDAPINPNPHSGLTYRPRPCRMDWEREERLAVEAADEAAGKLMAAAEALTALCDRYSGDSGDDADMIDNLTAEVDALAATIKRALGEPRVRLAGGLVPASMVRR